MKHLGHPSYNCSRNGLFAKYGSCRDYYQCDEITDTGLFIEHHFTCPLGMVFDDTLKTCDFASQVITRPECLKEETNPGANVEITRPVVLSIGETGGMDLVPDDDIVNSSPFLKRPKRFVITSMLIGMSNAAGALAVGTFPAAILTPAFASEGEIGSGGGTETDLRDI